MDYSVYEFSKEEWIKLVIGSLLFNGVISYLFYNSILLFFLLMPMIFVYSKLFKKSCMEKRMAKLNYDFKETMVALGSLKCRIFLRKCLCLGKAGNELNE